MQYLNIVVLWTLLGLALTAEHSPEGGYDWHFFNAKQDGKWGAVRKAFVAGPVIWLAGLYWFAKARWGKAS